VPCCSRDTWQRLRRGSLIRNATPVSGNFGLLAKRANINHIRCTSFFYQQSSTDLLRMRFLREIGDSQDLDRFSTAFRHPPRRGNLHSLWDITLRTSHPPCPCTYSVAIEENLAAISEENCGYVFSMVAPPLTMGAISSSICYLATFEAGGSQTKAVE